MEEDCRCWRPADWSHLPLDELSKKLSEYCRWWCTAVAPDLCTCLPIVLISLSPSATKPKKNHLSSNNRPPIRCRRQRESPPPPAVVPRVPIGRSSRSPRPLEKVQVLEREREGEGARERERYRELNAVKDLFHMEGAVLLVVALSPFAFTGSNEAATIGVNSERK